MDDPSGSVRLVGYLLIGAFVTVLCLLGAAAAAMGGG